MGCHLLLLCATSLSPLVGWQARGHMALGEGCWLVCGLLMSVGLPLLILMALLLFLVELGAGESKCRLGLFPLALLTLGPGHFVGLSWALLGLSSISGSHLLDARITPSHDNHRCSRHQLVSPGGSHQVSLFGLWGKFFLPHPPLRCPGLHWRC